MLTLVRVRASELEFRVWLEAKFMGAPISSTLENAQKTLKVAGVWDGNGLAAFTKKEWSKLGLNWTEVENKARKTASDDFRKLTISFKRDRRMVVEYAELFSSEGLVSSGVLAAEMGERFADTLGDDLLFVVPSRYRAFVFPKLGPDVSKFSGLVWSAYRENSYPVSVELFEWRKGNIRAVGLFEP